MPIITECGHEDSGCRPRKSLVALVFEKSCNSPRSGYFSEGRIDPTPKEIINMQDQSFRPLYDPTAVQPMRDELVRVGIRELKTPDEVDEVLGQAQGTTFLVINSVCGCAAGNARPGAMLALQNKVLPDHLVTVFAGQDRDATERVREYIKGYPPSSPCLVLFQNGEVHAILERQNIEGRFPQEIASDLVEAFNQVCERPGPSIPAEEFQKIIPAHMCGSSIPRLEDE